MTTLNARANKAYHDAIDEMDGWPFDSQRDVYETAWEDGYKAAIADHASLVAALEDK